MQPKLRFLVLVLTAALLALPASAAAGTRSATATAAGHFSVASATAKCPNDQLATGGGFSAPPAAGVGDPGLFVYESRKVGQRSWRASGQIFDSGAPAPPFSVTAYVYCRKGAPSTKSRSASVSLSSNNNVFVAADAKCKGSGRAQAGGFLAPPPFTGDYVMTDSYRADKKTWRSRVISTDPGGILTSYVYCADQRKPASRLGSISSSASPLFVTALSRECKSSTKPVAGGFSQPDATITPGGSFSRFHESFKSGKRWRVSARHAGSTTTLYSIAYCG
jgi:hypothetical protein